MMTTAISPARVDDATGSLPDAAFRTLFVQHPDALLLVDPFADVFLAANARACQLLRWPLERLMAMRPSSLHAGERGALVVFTQEVLERGEAWSSIVRGGWICRPVPAS
jgi:PAS domain-containing protein